MGMSFTTSVTIDAPVDRVFAVVSDVERLPDIVSAITSMEVISDGPAAPLRPGVRFRETRVLFGRQASETMDVLDVQRPGGPDGRASYTTGAESHGARYRTVMTVTPAGDDRSELGIEFSGTAVSLVAKLMSPLNGFFAKKCREATERDFAEIKRAIEAGEATHDAARADKAGVGAAGERR